MKKMNLQSKNLISFAKLKVCIGGYKPPYSVKVILDSMYEVLKKKLVSCKDSNSDFWRKLRETYFIRKSDKNLGLVILDKQVMLDKEIFLVTDQRYFQEIPEDLALKISGDDRIPKFKSHS